MSGRVLTRADGNRFLELLGISAIAVAQPVFASMGDAPEHFLVAGADRWTVVLFALAVVLLPPLVLWVVSALASRLTKRLGDLLHAASVAGLAAVLVALLVDQLTGRWETVGVAFGIVWLGGTVLFAEVPAIRAWPRVLSLAAPVIVVLFLFLSPVSALVLPEGELPSHEVRTNGAPVVLIVLDELPLTALLDGHGQIDKDLYPNLARFAGDSTWYRNTTTVHGFTTSAVPAIFTGRYPPSPARAPNSFNFPESLFTLLAPTYDVHAFENYDLCPSASCEGRDVDRVEVMSDLVSNGLSTIWDRLVPDAPPMIAFETAGPTSLANFAQLAASIEPGSHRLYVTHVFLPHTPFQFTADGRRYVDPDPYFGLAADQSINALRWNSDATAALARIRHRIQMQYTDDLLGEVLDRMRVFDIYDDAVVVITADHGVAFHGGEPHRVVTDATAPDILWVPLLVKAPGQDAPVVTDVNVETVDILPTIASLLDAEIPWPIDGVVAGSRDTDVKRFFSDWNGAAGVEGIPFDGTAHLARVLKADASQEGPSLRFAPYATGVHDNLLGVPVGERDMESAAHGEVSIDDLRSYAEIAQDRPLPLVVQGTLHAGEPVEALAVVVNGRIAAVVEPYRTGTQYRFAAMIPDFVLRTEDNRVEVFGVSRDRGRLELLRLEHS